MIKLIFGKCRNSLETNEPKPTLGVRFLKPKKQFTKGFKCDLCDKKYTWYTGLSNHKRFVHNNKTKET